MRIVACGDGLFMEFEDGEQGMMPQKLVNEREPGFGLAGDGLIAVSPEPAR